MKSSLARCRFLPQLLLCGLTRTDKHNTIQPLKPIRTQIKILQPMLTFSLVLKLLTFVCSHLCRILRGSVKKVQKKTVVFMRSTQFKWKVILMHQSCPRLKPYGMQLTSSGYYKPLLCPLKSNIMLSLYTDMWLFKLCP